MLQSRMVEEMPQQKLQFYHLLACTCSLFCRDNVQTGRRHA